MSEQELFDRYVAASMSFRERPCDDTERAAIEAFGAFAAEFDPLSAHENTEALRRTIAVIRKRLAA